MIRKINEQLVTARVGNIVLDRVGVDNKLLHGNVKLKEVDLLAFIGAYDRTIGHLDSTNIVIPDLIKKEDIKIQDATFWRFPKINLPRDKFALIKDKYNCAITRDRDKADYLIVSEEHLGRLVDRRNWCQNILPVEKFMAYWYDRKPRIGEALYGEIVRWASQYDHINLRCNYTWEGARKFPSTYKDFNANIPEGKTPGPFFGSEYNSVTTVLDIDGLEYFLSRTNMVLDKDIVEFCNEDSIVVDQEQFDNLISMVESNDKENITMAMEIMANCNIQKSEAALGYIYAFYHYELRGAKNWNTVNVKSLKKVLENYRIWGTMNQGTPYNMFIRRCLDRGTLTEMVLRKVTKLLYDKVIKFNFGDSPFEFNIEDIKLKKEDKEKVIDQELSELPF